VKDQSVPRIELDENGFSAALKADDGTSEGALHVAGGEAERLIAKCHGTYAAAASPGFEAASDGFNFWKFWHNRFAGADE
jgi:hypothetical protein